MNRINPQSKISIPISKNTNQSNNLKITKTISSTSPTDSLVQRNPAKLLAQRKSRNQINT